MRAAPRTSLEPAIAGTGLATSRLSLHNCRRREHILVRRHVQCVPGGMGARRSGADTTADPDGVVARHGLGISAEGSWEKFVTGRVSCGEIVMRVRELSRMTRSIQHRPFLRSRGRTLEGADQGIGRHATEERLTAGRSRPVMTGRFGIFTRRQLRYWNRCDNVGV